MAASFVKIRASCEARETETYANGELKVFGSRLRQLRDERAIPRKSWLNKLDSIATTSAAFKRGERNVTLENTVKLAKALSVRPGDLFADFS